MDGGIGRLVEEHQQRERSGDGSAVDTATATPEQRLAYYAWQAAGQAGSFGNAACGERQDVDRLALLLRSTRRFLDAAEAEMRRLGRDDGPRGAGDARAAAVTPPTRKRPSASGVRSVPAADRLGPAGGDTRGAHIVDAMPVDAGSGTGMAEGIPEQSVSLHRRTTTAGTPVSRERRPPHGAEADTGAIPVDRSDRAAKRPRTRAKAQSARRHERGPFSLPDARTGDARVARLWGDVAALVRDVALMNYLAELALTDLAGFSGLVDAVQGRVTSIGAELRSFGVVPLPSAGPSPSRSGDGDAAGAAHGAHATPVAVTPDLAGAVATGTDRLTDGVSPGVGDRVLARLAACRAVLLAAVDEVERLEGSLTGTPDEASIRPAFDAGTGLATKPPNNA